MTLRNNISISIYWRYYSSSTPSVDRSNTGVGAVWSFSNCTIIIISCKLLRELLLGMGNTEQQQQKDSEQIRIGRWFNYRIGRTLHAIKNKQTVQCLWLPIIEIYGSLGIFSIHLIWCVCYFHNLQPQFYSLPLKWLTTGRGRTRANWPVNQSIDRTIDQPFPTNQAVIRFSHRITGSSVTDRTMRNVKDLLFAPLIWWIKLPVHFPTLLLAGDIFDRAFRSTGNCEFISYELAKWLIYALNTFDGYFRRRSTRTNGVLSQYSTI